MATAADTPTTGLRKRMDTLRSRLQRLLLWRVWERMLEIEFVDRSIALAGKAFVSFFPLVIVIAAFMPDRTRASIIFNVSHRLGIQGESLVTFREAFASSEHVRDATGVLGLVLTIFFATSFTTALQRVYLRAWRRPSRSRPGAYVRGPCWLIVMVASIAVLGALRSALGDGLGFGVFLLLALAEAAALWWFTAWFLLVGEVRGRVLVPTGIVTGVAIALYSASATIWMPNVVSDNSAQFGFFGISLALVTWFSGAAICMLIGACVGPVFAEDTGPVGRLIRGGDDAPTLTVGADPALPPPVRGPSLRDAFQSRDES